MKSSCIISHPSRGGAGPNGGVTADSTGNLYGTTAACGTADAGVVYKLDTAGQETVLYTFTGGPDGGSPYSGVILVWQLNSERIVGNP